MSAVHLPSGIPLRSKHNVTRLAVVLQVLHCAETPASKGVIARVKIAVGDAQIIVTQKDP
jgi:hypothetical protein